MRSGPLEPTSETNSLDGASIDMCSTPATRTSSTSGSSSKLPGRSGWTTLRSASSGKTDRSRGALDSSTHPTFAKEGAPDQIYGSALTRVREAVAESLGGTLCSEGGTGSAGGSPGGL